MLELRGCADAWKSEELDEELAMFFRPRDSLANLTVMETCWEPWKPAEAGSLGTLGEFLT